jgi:hypothetical protein
VTSRPEIEISDKRLAFSTQTSSIEPSYKTAPKRVKIVDFSRSARFFENIPRAECSSHAGITAQIYEEDPAYVFDAYGNSIFGSYLK